VKIIKKFILNICSIFLILKRRISYSSFASDLRINVAKLLGAQIGNEVIVRPGVILKGHKNIEIGSNCFIGENTVIVAYGARVKIGKNVLIADGVYISCRNHRFSDKDKLIKDQGYSCKDISVDDDVWLGHNSIVLAGSNVPKKTIVGAGALFDKSETIAKIHRQKTKTELILK
jgi:acetyltransferase-like isoleucine patch superfamily enzyme